MGEITLVGVDNFSMDGQIYDVDTMIMVLQMGRVENLDQSLLDQSQEIKDRNERIKTANEFLAEMRGLKAAEADNDPSAAYIAFANSNNINIPHTDIGDCDNAAEKWDANIEAVKGFIDAQNSTSQMDMIRLQQLMNKRNQSYETMTNTISKEAKTKDSIISNYR